MNTRNKVILHLLSENQSQYTTIDQIAEVTGAGIRTIHRDLTGLERSLGFRGLKLERRRGYGIRLMDPLPDNLAESLIPTAESSYLRNDQRPMLILLYLIVAGDWIKLSELAHVLFVSDSTISSDVNTLKSQLPDGFVIDRQKGIGIRLIAREDDTRLLFLSAFPVVFPHYVIFGESGRSISEGRLITAFKVRHDEERIKDRIKETESLLGYQFSPSYRCLLYSYLYLLSRRLPASCFIKDRVKSNLDIPEPFRKAAKVMLETDLIEYSHSPVVITAELEVLARIIASCETSIPPTSSVDKFMGDLKLSIETMLERSLNRLEEKEKIWLHDDRILLNYLRMTITAATYRIDLGLSFWKKSGLITYPCIVDIPETDILTSQFLTDFDRILNEPEPEIVRQELQEASLALTARLETIRSRNSREIRVGIFCYEGLGMSNYILSIARDVFPARTVFNTMWELDLDDNLKSDGYHLVISTHPLHLWKPRQLILNGDNSPEEIRRQLKEFVREMDFKPVVLPRDQKKIESSGNMRTSSPGDEKYSLRDVISVISGFFVEQEVPGGNLISQAVSALDNDDCDIETLIHDFNRRESFGSLRFEELNIRILHCRSRGIPEPRAGVIQTKGNESTVLVIAAPLTAEQAQTHALSEIVIALTDSADFAEILARGSKSDIQSHLLTIFGRKNKEV